MAIVLIIIPMAHYTSANIRFYQEKKIQFLILFISSVKLTTFSPNSTENEHTDFSCKSELCLLSVNNC